MSAQREALRRRILQLIDDLANGQRDDATRDALICDLARWQSAHVEPYQRIIKNSKRDLQTWHTPAEFPAVFSDLFRFDRVSAFAASETQRVFYSSGTTEETRSRHDFRDLSLYLKAAQAAARYALFPDCERMDLVILAPCESEAPHSSLSFMLARFAEWFGNQVKYVWSQDQIDFVALRATLDRACGDNSPLAILGTSFAFVHTEDALGTAQWLLPRGSRMMQTGGYKGKSRAVAPNTLRRMLSERYGVPQTHIIAEYGMTELSSQCYQRSLRDAVIHDAHSLSSVYWVPGWMRLSCVDAESGHALEPGSEGLLRIEDCANLDSVCILQTADLATVVSEGVEISGRHPQASPKGCSYDASQRLSDPGVSFLKRFE